MLDILDVCVIPEPQDVQCIDCAKKDREQNQLLASNVALSKECDRVTSRFNILQSEKDALATENAQLISQLERGNAADIGSG